LGGDLIARSRTSRNRQRRGSVEALHCADAECVFWRKAG